MKIKYLIGCLGICSLLTVGVYYGKEVLSTYKSAAETVSMGNDLVQEYADLTSNIASLQEQLSTAGKDVFLDNAKVASEFAGLSGATISSIDALEDASNLNSVLITITNPDDVAFFTDTVTAISYSFTITDMNAFLNALSSATFIAEDVEIDLDNNTARIIVPSSSALYTRDASAESISENSTESVIENNTENVMESTETVSIPENSGVYDSPDDVTGIGEVTDLSDNEDYDMNYYVIESTEGE